MSGQGPDLRLLYPEVPQLSRSQLFSSYKNYVLKEYDRGASLSLLLKPLFNLFHGVPGATQWKKKLMWVIQSKDPILLQEFDAQEHIEK